MYFYLLCFQMRGWLVDACLFLHYAARRKLLERAGQAGLGGFKKTRKTKATVKDMWDGGKGKFTRLVHQFNLSCTIIRC